MNKMTFILILYTLGYKIYIYQLYSDEIIWVYNLGDLILYLFKHAFLTAAVTYQDPRFKTLILIL